MKKLLISFLILVCGSFFFSCSVLQILNQESKEVRKAKRKLKRANKNIQQALELAPELGDSINRKEVITVTIPGKTDTVLVKTVIDTSDFVQKIGVYDSLLMYQDSLQDLVDNNKVIGVQYEEVRSRLLLTSQALYNMKSELIKGFLIDSTYVYDNDSIRLELSIIDGQINNILWSIKEQKIDTAVNTQKIIFQDGPKKKTVFHWVGLTTMILLIIGFILLLIFRKKWS